MSLLGSDPPIAGSADGIPMGSVPTDAGGVCPHWLPSDIFHCLASEGAGRRVAAEARGRSAGRPWENAWGDETVTHR